MLAPDNAEDIESENNKTQTNENLSSSSGKRKDNDQV
jgi:hypothetical protein